MAYAYNADWLCDKCAEEVIEELEQQGLEDEGDTNQWPQACDQFEESDSPDHCCNCQEYLGFSLTTDGVAYVIEYLIDALDSGSISSVERIWADDLSNYGLSKADAYIVRAARELPTTPEKESV
jgi:hypothetical protein